MFGQIFYGRESILIHAPSILLKIEKILLKDTLVRLAEIYIFLNNKIVLCYFFYNILNLAMILKWYDSLYSLHARIFHIIHTTFYT